MIVDKLEEVLLPAAALDKAGRAWGSQVGLGSWLPVGRKHPVVGRQLPGSNLARCQGTVAAQVALHKGPTGLGDRLENTQELPCHSDTPASTLSSGRTLFDTRAATGVAR